MSIGRVWFTVMTGIKNYMYKLHIKEKQRRHRYEKSGVFVVNIVRENERLVLKILYIIWSR